MYTITNCVWLNDILNSPAYKPYVDGFRSYYLWTLYIKNVIKKRIIQEKRKKAKFMTESNQTNETENAEGPSKPENPMVAFLENNIENLKGLSEKITEKENSIELSIVKLRPIFRKNNLINLTQNASNYLESFTKMPVMSDKNSVLNEIFDVINEYVYDTQEEEEVPETDPNKETPEVTNHRLLYKLLKNIFLFKSHKKNLSQLLNHLPPIQNNYDVYFYTGLNTKRSEDYYRQNLFTDVILDVVDGLVDDSNKSMVKCYYYDHWIGKMMNFFNGAYWDVAKDRVYVNLMNVQNKVEDAEDDTGNGNNPESGPPGYGDSGYGNGNSGYGNSSSSGYGNSYDTMMPTTTQQNQQRRSSDQAKKNLPILTPFFNEFILDTNNASKTIPKDKKELLKQILAKIRDTELYVGKGLDLEFEIFNNIVNHKGVDALSRIVIQNTNIKDELVTIKSYDDFLLENTTILKRLSDDALSKMNPNNNTGMIAEWSDNKSKVVKMIQSITVDIEKFLEKIKQTPTTDKIVEYNGVVSEPQKNIYSVYLLLFLYKTVFELVKDYYERKISELKGQGKGGKTQKYSHTHSANHKTRKHRK